MEEPPIMTTAAVRVSAEMPATAAVLPPDHSRTVGLEATIPPTEGRTGASGAEDMEVGADVEVAVGIRGVVPDGTIPSRLPAAVVPITRGQTRITREE